MFVNAIFPQIFTSYLDDGLFSCMDGHTCQLKKTELIKVNVEQHRYHVIKKSKTCNETSDGNKHSRNFV